MTDQDCPLARLGAEAQSIVAGMERLQLAQADAEQANKLFLQNRERMLSDQLEALEALMSYRIATSLNGVLLQVAQLKSSVDTIASHLDEKTAKDLKDMIGRADVLAWAAIRGLEAHGADRDAVGGDYYCSRRCDPFEDCEQAA